MIESLRIHKRKCRACDRILKVSVEYTSGEMATILILQEQPVQDEVLERSLGGDHQLIFADCASVAIAYLNEHSVDLIITRVHLKKGSIFPFLRDVKRDPRLQQIPVICFCGVISHYARVQHKALANATKTSGAVDYVTLEQFLKEGEFDLEEIRKRVERYLQDDFGDQW